MVTAHKANASSPWTPCCYVINICKSAVRQLNPIIIVTDVANFKEEEFQLTVI